MRRELFKLNPQAQQHYSAQWLATIKASDSLKLADFAAAITTADGAELQAILEGTKYDIISSLTLSYFVLFCLRLSHMVYSDSFFHVSFSC